MKLRLLAMLLVATLATVTSLALAQENNFRFVIISDAHVGKKDEANKRRYLEIVAEITNSIPKPRAVFSTGDLVDNCREENYDNYIAWIQNPIEAAGIKHYAIPGNHEVASSTNFNALGVWIKKMGPLYQAVTIENTRFILTCGMPENFAGGYGTRPATSKLPPKAAGIGQGGFIESNQLAWIQRELESPAARQADLLIIMNHFPLWPVDFGGYQIQDDDIWGNHTQAGTLLRQWVDDYNVDIFMCGHRHFQAPPVTQEYPSGHKALHVLSESAIMGASFKFPDPKREGKTRYYGGFGYEIYDVNGNKVSHVRKTIKSAGFSVVGPTNQFDFTASPKKKR